MAKKTRKKTLGVNPWLRIWAKPRDTIAKIVKFNPKHRFIILSFLYGLPMLLHMAQNFSFGEDYTIGGIVIVAIVLATFVGMLAITIASALLLWTGRWIGGEGDYFPVRAAVSWSNVPNIFSILVWAVLIFFFRDKLFLDEFNEQTFAGMQFGIVSGALVLQAILSIWSFIMLIKGLGQVHGFSAWKGILNVLIPFFIIGILIWLISWIFWACDGMPMPQ